MAVRKQPLDQFQRIVDADGRPNIYFIRFMQDALAAIASSITLQTLLDTLGTTEGDIIYYDGTDWVVLPIGTAGQHLASDGTDPVWETPTVYSIQTMLDGISTTQGVVLYYNGTDWVALAPGTSGHFLQTLGAGANPVWASAAANIQTLLDGISTTQGTVLYYNGTDWVALAPGTAGQFLRTGGAGSNPSWADRKYSLPFGFTTATTASEVMLLHSFAEAVTFPANFSGSTGFVGGNPSATFTFTVAKGTPGSFSTVGTISVSTGGVVTFATSGGVAVSFAAGDSLRVTAQAGVEAAMINCAFTFLGVR